MSKKDNFQDTIVRILTEGDNSLDNLAKIAGADPKTFYRTANFRNADLAGEDLSKFDLTMARMSQLNESEAKFQYKVSDFEVIADDAEYEGSVVRMSANVLDSLHSLLSNLNYRKLSQSLERDFRIYLNNFDGENLKIFNSRDLEEEVHNKLVSIGVVYPLMSTRHAYSFSSELRDYIYDLAEHLGVTSGVVISRMLYHLFLNDGLSGGREIPEYAIDLTNREGENLSRVFDAIKKMQDDR